MLSGLVSVFEDYVFFLPSSHARNMDVHAKVTAIHCTYVHTTRTDPGGLNRVSNTLLHELLLGMIPLSMTFSSKSL